MKIKDTIFTVHFHSPQCFDSYTLNLLRLASEGAAEGLTFLNIRTEEALKTANNTPFTEFL